MSLQHRSSTERLTPEYRPPDHESSPLDYTLDDVLPYDSFDDESFMGDSPSDHSSHTAGSVASFLSDTPDLDIIAAMDRSLADVELDLLLAQGEDAPPPRQDRDATPDSEALLVCRRAADLEHRLAVLTVQVRQLNRDGPRISRQSVFGAENANWASELDEQVSFPVEDREIEARARDPDFLNKVYRQLEDMDIQIGRVDAGMIGMADINLGASYMFSTVDRLYAIDRNVAHAVEKLLDGLRPEDLFRAEAAARGLIEREPTFEILNEELNVRTVEIERLENGLDRELSNRLRAAEMVALRPNRGVLSRLRYTPAERLHTEPTNGDARLKLQWLQRQQENLRRLRYEASARPSLHPDVTRSVPAHNVWPSNPFQRRLRLQPTSGSDDASSFRSRLEARAEDNQVNSNRDAAVSLLLAQYRRWQTRQAAANAPSVPSLLREDGQESGEPRPLNDESEYEDLFMTSSPVQFLRDTPRHPLNRRNGEDELVDVEIGRSRETPRDPSRDGGPQVVDLTEEPDSPVMAREWPGGLFPPRMLRRRASGRAGPPPLARSDSSILGAANGTREVIDLTEDDPEPRLDPERMHRDMMQFFAPDAEPQPNHARSHRPRARPVLPGSPDLLFVDARPRTRSAAQRRGPHAERLPRDFGEARENPAASFFNRTFGVNNMFQLLNPHLTGHRTPFDPVGPINLQYGFHAFHPGQHPSPKPTAETPPSARPGFTRDTDPETAFVCPGCNEELAYDPEDTSNAATSTRTKGKRSRSEHHFWALKSCGHVSFLL